MEVIEPLPNLNESTQCNAPSEVISTHCVHPPTEKQLAVRISVETTHKMHAAKAAKRKAEKDALAELEALRAQAEIFNAQTDENYRKRELTHTRDEIEACRTAMISLRNGPARDYKAMSDALWRLREIERHLAGWPGPGNRQPSKERAAPASTTAEPL